MRKIKFRAWLKVEKQMVEVTVIDFYLKSIYWIDDPTVFDKEADMSKIELMQFIGLKDKNGVEVYEGDILTLENGNVIGAVRFNERICSFELCDEKSGDSYWLLQDPSLKYEIIGNIYDVQNTKGEKTKYKRKENRK